MKFKKAKEIFDAYNTEWKDHHIYAHGIRVMDYCTEVYKEMNPDNAYMIDLSLAAKYHDIGKILFSPKLISGGYTFTEKDIKLFKKHVKRSYEILKAFYGDGSIAEIALHHHERMDGSGYFKGLKGEEIPLGSRIIAVCDTYDAMFRHYNRKTKEQAVEELKKLKKTQLDEKVVDIFLETIGHKDEYH